MTKLKVLCAFAAFVLLGACVSTSTGAKKPVADNAAAANQYYQLGVQYYRNENYEFARDRLHRAIDFDPKMGEAHSMLALTYFKLGNTRLATQHHERAVRADPNNFDVRNAYAIYLCQTEEFDEARNQFDRAIKVYNNDNAEIMLTNAGTCMAKKPDFELAENYLRQAIALKPSYGEALIQLASVKHRMGDNLHARAFVQRYLVSNPASAPVLYLAIEVEKALGDNRASTDYINQLLRDYPDSAEARYLMDRSASR